MKIDLFNYTPPAETTEYPCIKRSSQGCVVLFSRYCVGTVLIAGSSGYGVGEYSCAFKEGSYYALPEGAGITITN